MRKVRAEFALHVSADVAQARSDIERFRDVQQRNGIGIGVSVALNKAQAEMAAFRARQQGNDVTVKVKADTSTAKRDIEKLKAEISAGFGAAGSALGPALLFSGGFAGIGQLPALATAIAGVTGALEQLSGAGVAIPGVIGGILASVGTAKIGLIGVADAYTALDKAADGSAKNVDAANKALAQLAPSARDAVTTAHNLAGELKNALVQPIQQNLFSGVAGDLRNLVSADLPILQRGLSGIATSLNSNIRQILTSLGSDSSKGLLDRILGNTGDAQARLSSAIDPLIKGLATLTASGTDVLPRLADDVGRLAERFSAFITEADQNGTLAKFINDGITGVEQLGDTFVNVGKIINTVVQSAGGGQGLLGTLDDASKKLDAFLKTPGGQEALKKFFTEGKQDLRDLLDVAKELPGVLKGIFDAGKTAADIFLPVIKDVLSTVNAIPGGVKTIAEAFLAWKFVGVIAGVVDAVKAIVTALGLVGPAAATAGTAGAAGLSPLTALLANPALAAILAAGAFGAGIGPLLNAGADARLKALNDAWNKNAAGDAGVPAVIGPVQGPGFGPVGPSSGPQLPVSPPVGPSPGAGTRPGGTVIPVTPPPGVLDKKNPFAGPYAKGGPTPSGRGNGPTGGWISELHGNEWVLPAHARSAVGDKALWALTSGRSFAPGGYVDQFGNPITPGSAPGGPAPIAPTAGGGGVQAAVGSFLSGIGGPIGNIAGLIQGGVGGSGSGSSGTKLTPGFAGLAQAGNNPDLLNQWGTQTGEWLGNFGAKTLTSFATTLWQGALGFFGLQNSILSPTNPWFQDASKTAGFFLGQGGPLDNSQSGDSQGAQSASSLPDASHHGGPSSLSPSSTSPSASLLPSSSLPTISGLPGGVTLGPSGAVNYKATYPGGGGGAAPAGGNQQAVYQAMITAGYPPSEWSSLTNLLNGESGFRNTAQNPSSTAYGMFQFLDSTWAGVGGSKTSDPGLQAQYGLQYIKQRYGSPSKAWSFWQSQSPHWYSVGGASHGPGGPKGDQIPALLSDDEHVFTASDVAAMGGQGAVYAFRNALHRSAGGPVSQGAIMWPKEPVGRTDKTRPGGVPDLDPGKSHSQIGLPDWGTPGQTFGPPPSGWWDKPVNRDDILNPEWMPPGQRDEWLNKWGDRRRRWKPLGYAIGGAVTGLPVDPRRPFPRPPDAQKIIAPPVPTPSGLGPPALQPPPAPAQIAPTPQPAAPEQGPPPPPATIAPTGPVPSGGAPDSSATHLLPAVSTGITSGFAAAGNAASAIASAFSGGAAGGAGGLIGGAFQQLGKIAVNVANVGASMLVGSVPGSFGDPNLPAGGATLRPAQRQPQTAPLNGPGNSYVFNGIRERDVVDELRLKDAQDQQAMLATSRG